MTDLLRLIRKPLVQAPMAGGPSNPGLAAAVCEAGGLGFVAAGYLTADQLAGQIAETRRRTDEAFGVNVFVPGTDPVDDATVLAYRDRLTEEARRLGVEPGSPQDSDDAWPEKIELLLADPVPLVSFTFGCPDREVIEAFRGVGSAVLVTVTSDDEARIAVEAGADGLCVQGIEAGGHRGSFHNGDGPDLPLQALLTSVAGVTDRPLIAAGGLSDPAAVTSALAAGAVAVQAGTAFLRCHESGAHPLHQRALGDPRFTQTTLTRAFTGRRARALVNRFVTEYGQSAPKAYPQVSATVRPVRAAALAAGDVDLLPLWAGTGFRQATTRSAGEVVDLLLSG